MKRSRDELWSDSRYAFFQSRGVPGSRTGLDSFLQRVKTGVACWNAAGKKEMLRTTRPRRFNRFYARVPRPRSPLFSLPAAYHRPAIAKNKRVPSLSSGLSSDRRAKPILKYATRREERYRGKVLSRLLSPGHR